jgi:hypothetical protein
LLFKHEVLRRATGPLLGTCTLPHAISLTLRVWPFGRVAAQTHKAGSRSGSTSHEYAGVASVEEAEGLI